MLKGLEINEMIDLIDDFLQNEDSHQLMLNGMIGSGLSTLTIQQTLLYYKFPKILIIEGCQDYIGLDKVPIKNHIFYAQAFVEMMIDSIIEYDCFKPQILNPYPEYQQILNMNMINEYDVIIVSDAHLIQSDMLNAIIKNFSGKIICIFDPFESDAHLPFPVLTDTLSRVSPMIAMARSIFGVDSRSIDRSIKCGVNEAKVSKRSIGKIDTNQYISNDPCLINIIRDKQYQTVFRKHQKFLVSDNHLTQFTDEVGQIITIRKNSMFTIDSNVKPLMKLRLYGSKQYFFTNITYSDEPSYYSYPIHVKPGNILNLEEQMHHRYNHAIVITAETLSPAQRYSLLKNSNYLTIAT